MLTVVFTVRRERRAEEEAKRQEQNEASR
jgi:hypothetical protein